MELTLTYLLDGESGTITVTGSDYENAKAEARQLLPAEATPISYRVHR